MRYAIFTSTLNGCRQAARLESALLTAGTVASLHTVDVFVHAKAWPALAEEIPSVHWQKYGRLADIVGKIFSSYDGLIFVMASGIVVRTIAPHIVNKLRDPAVLVMDDRGRNIISLLSGHVGGANALTAQLAKALGSNPVITTATDVNDFLAPDTLAGILSARPYPAKNLLHFNSSILRGVKPCYWLDKDIKCFAEYTKRLDARQVDYKVMTDIPCGQAVAHGGSVNDPCRQNVAQEQENTLGGSCKQAAAQVCGGSKDLQVLITDRQENLPLGLNILYLQPRRLVAGVGCRRGTSQEEVLAALQSACHSIGWPVERLDVMASTVVKAQEQGLLAAAEQLGLPITFFENEVLAEKITSLNLTESAFVKKTIGVGNVCEAAAFAAVPQGILALPKTKYEKVTVALVWQK